ncbi:MAG: AAA family ATPase, partial [Mycobacteriales bacterium]
MQVLERGQSLEALAEYAQEAGNRDGRLVLVSGEAGVGKTTLLDEFAQIAPQARWLRAACDGLSTPRPLGPLVDIAGEVGGELLQQCRDRVARDEIFATAQGEFDQPGVLTVVVIEDIHWADESTLDLLRYVGRRLRGAAILLIATYRDEGLAPDDPLRIVLGDLSTLPTSRRVSVAPLSAEAVAELATGTGLDPSELYRLTGGNPFFVSEALCTPEDRIPPSARDAVLARVARLSDDARQAVRTAALIGTSFDPALLTAIAVAEALVLDELLSSGLLVSDDRTLRFRHEITRLAVEQDVPAYRRTSIHARILVALMAAGCEDESMLAHHAEGADDGDAAFGLAVRAGDRAAELSSHREAIAQYERALRFAGKEQPAIVADLYD